MRVSLTKPMYLAPRNGAVSWHDKGEVVELASGSPVSIFMEPLDAEATAAIDAEKARRRLQQPYQYDAAGKYAPLFWFPEPIRK
jgi:hypothetical protein